jgi:hypothetical protein
MASLFLPKKVVKKMSIGHASKMSNFGLDYIFSQGSDASNFLGGWDGQAFHPNVKEDEKLNVFATDICSAAPIEFAVRIKQINIYIYISLSLICLFYFVLYIKNVYRRSRVRGILHILLICSFMNYSLLRHRN